MFLTEASVLHYLCGRGFADLGAVTSGTYIVRNLSRRNRNFRVSTGAAEFLVKQARQWNSAGRGTIEREAALCRRAHTDPAFEPLRRLVPATYSYDPNHSILIFEFLPGRSPLSDSSHRFAPEVARAAARTMAAFHRGMSGPEIAAQFPGAAPGVLSMHRWEAERLPDPSPGQRELIQLVRRHSTFGDALDELRAGWNPSALIHGDWKMENCLVAEDGAGLHVIDWELAAWGDPLWDAATLLQSWWNRWVRDPERYPIEEIRPALHAFLDAYAAPVAPIVAYAGARMLQTAWESLQKSKRIAGEAVRLAQAALHILTRPDWAREQLLGNSGTGFETAGAVCRNFVACPRIAEDTVPLADSDQSHPREEVSSPPHDAELLDIFAAMPGPPDDPDTLYARCYSRPLDGALAAGDPGDLASSNATRESIDYGWEIEQPSAEGCVIARKAGAVRLFRPGQYLTLRGPGAKIEPGEAIRVFVAAGAADLQPGFYHAFGETVSDYVESEDLLRVYWNLSAPGAAPLLAAVTREFNRFGIPFRFKCGQQPEIYERRDSAVLYFHRRYFPIASHLIERIHADAAPWMRDGVPLFTLPLGRGLALAEDPGESFGKNRCAILSESMTATRGLPPPDRLADLRRRFATRALSLDTPWSNSGTGFETSRRTLPGFRCLSPNCGGMEAPRVPPSNNQYLEIAARLGARLCRDALWSSATCNWTSGRPEGTSAPTHAALIPQLYSGTSGIALALARLAAATGDSIFRVTAEAAIDCALSRLPAGCGYYTGGLGVLYAAAEIRDQLNAAAILRQSGPARAALDIITGSAGAIAALLYFHRRLFGDPLLDMAARHGDLLIDAAVREDAGWSWNTIAGVCGQTGFSHGAAGIAWALLELWRATGELRFRCAALEGLRFERSCFDASRGNWPDFRDTEPRFESVWCHGSAGIALSRMRAWRLLGDPDLLEEARIALADVRAELPALENFSLCHGVAGCADVLIEAAQILNQSEFLTTAEAAAQSGIERYERPRRPWPGGMNRMVETPDLMWGTAGIAWFYLRMADPCHTPTPLIPCG